MNIRSSDHVVATFDGGDALSFLQSQLTNDVAALAVGAWQWQGYCTAKGRLQATFAVARTSEFAFLAVLHHSVAANLVKRLTMFRMRAKLAIELNTAASVWLHLSPPATEVNSLASLDLGHGRWVTVDKSAGTEVEISDSDRAFMQRWNGLGIDALQPEITAATAEMFVPQMINWDHVKPGGGVSFSKGCYPGQEVVARAHYRGAVKRQLERQILADDTNAANGREVTLEDGRSAYVCNAALREQGGTVALVVATPATAQ